MSTNRLSCLSGTESRLTIHLLGPLEVRRGNRILAVSAGKQRALLATLATAPGRAVPVDAIIDRLWADRSPPQVGTTVRGYVKRLRRVLDTGAADSVIRATGGGYRLDITDADTDVGQFVALVRQVGASRPGEAALDRIDRALTLWRGSALSDVPSESLRDELLPAWTELRLHAVQRRNEIRLAAGDCAEVIAELRGLVAEYPLEERLWAQLIRALCRAGRPAAALGQYETCRRVLADRLGIDPSPQLRTLHRQILVGDPSLAA